METFTVISFETDPRCSASHYDVLFVTLRVFVNFFHCHILCHYTEMYLRPCQTATMGLHYGNS